MGRGMARNLHRAGLLHARLEPHRRARPRELADELRRPAPQRIRPNSPALCDVVVLCVSADADVLEMVDAMLPGLRPGTIVIDCSTVSADTAREAARRLAERSRRVPRRAGQRRRRRRAQGHARDHGRRIGGRVRAGATGARGDGPHVTHFGPTGAGQAAKATNQIMCAGHHPGRRRGHGLREGRRPAARGADRDAGQGRGIELVLRAPRAEHGAQRISAGLPRAPAREGPAHLPRHGRAPRRAAARGRDDAAALPPPDRAGPRRRGHLDAVPDQGRAVRRGAARPTGPDSSR